MDGGGSGALGEVGGEEAQRLALIGGQRGAVAFKVARDAAAGGAGAVAQSLDASLPLQLCRDRDTDTTQSSSQCSCITSHRQAQQTPEGPRLSPPAGESH